MKELLEQIIEQIRGSWRFRRYALIAAWIVAVIGWIVLFILPDVYEAHSRVFVDTKTELKPVLQGIIIDQDVNAQLNLVRQSLLSAPELETLAQEVGLLDPRTVSAQQRARIINALRDRVEVTVTRASDSQDSDAGTIYAIQYKDTSRDRGLKVVDVLQTRLIENTLGGKRTGSENAQKFLERQIQDLEQRLRLAEDRLAEFKKRNVGLMPDEQGGYFNRLQTEIETVRTGQSALTIALSRREELQRQLRGEAPIAAATGLPNGNSGANGSGGGDTLSRIKETQGRLDDLLLRFTEKHPDVIAARENLEQLKQRRIVELEALKRGDPNAAASSGASSNPVYQSIQLALNQTDVEIASRRQELAVHQLKVTELRKSLDTMPQVEAEYARLNRDYDVTKSNYTALVERLEKSRLGEEATTSGSVRFNVIEPPNSPFKPVSPKRTLLILAVFIFAVGAGSGVAFLLHQLKPVFTSTRGLAEATGMQVLGSISLAWQGEQQVERRRSYVRYSVAVGALLVLAVVALQLNRMGIRLSAADA
jgi:polysaccharide chain length determinant protein (PEP-CTERM system associated)